MRSTGAASSSEFRVFETEEFGRALGRVGRTPFLRKKLDGYVYPQLRHAPYHGPNIRKLHGYSPETWRYRIGAYRVFYSIDPVERIVFMLTVDDRKDAYR